MSPSRDLCLLFDLDGTLVDSEALGYQGFLDLLPELNDTADNLVSQYRGMKMDGVLADFEKRLGRALGEEFEPRYRQRVAELFDSSLNPMPGTAEALDALPYARGIVSAGPQKKIRHALTVTGLDRFFEQRHLFSCYDIHKWKPEPDLYLHAAKSMGYRPEQCIVIEDSTPGVQAGLSANMRVLLYEPDAHYTGPVPTHRFSHMSDLPGLIQAIG